MFCIGGTCNKMLGNIKTDDDHAARCKDEHKRFSTNLMFEVSRIAEGGSDVQDIYELPDLKTPRINPMVIVHSGFVLALFGSTEVLFPDQLATSCEVISMADIKQYYRISKCATEPRKPKFIKIEIEFPLNEPNIAFCKSCLLPIGESILIVGGLHASKKGSSFSPQL